jgi:AcrR family transcriptional regulator
MVTSSGTPRRSWRGISPDERQARRREQLVDAAFAMMGTDGTAAVTMRGVCREAKLTERYFYESFSGREELLVVVLESVVHQARDVLVRAVEQGPRGTDDLIRAAVRAFTDFVTADPRRGRVLLVESTSAPELAGHAFELVDEFVTTISAALRLVDPGGADADDLDVDLNAQAVFGALALLYQSWLGGRMQITRERFVEHISQVIENVARSSSANADGSPGG